MKTILFANHSQENCGVQSYGKRVAQIFKGSRRWNVVYVEPASTLNLTRIASELQPKVILYNYLPQTLTIVTHPLIEGLRAVGIKQGLIVHNPRNYYERL